MATICLTLNFLGIAAAIAAALTVTDIMPGFVQLGSILSPEIATGIFWSVIAIILLLSGIAFGVYQIADSSTSRNEK